jgi:nanoRNase/pAp phosphatase (c-di-AMP/oligoRNAs hydrolase)
MQAQYVGGMATPTDRKHLQHIIEIARKRGAIITTHGTPDVDGVGGCFALQRHIVRNNAVADIVTGQTISLTDPLVEKLGAKLVGWHAIEDSDSRPVIVVDTNSASLLTGCTKKDFLAIIDHHEISQPELEAKFRIINGKAISVCEIIASLIPEADIDKMSALALAVGIAGDSERLRDTDQDTLAIFDRLVLMCGETKKTIDALALPPLKPEVVVAVMEELKHLRTELYCNKTVSVGASSLANPAILATKVKELDVSVGAILGTVLAGTKPDENWYKISFRVRHQEVLEGIYASDIARLTGEKCAPADSHGGGHEDKAAVVVLGRKEDIIRAVFDAAKEAIDKALGSKV